MQKFTRPITREIEIDGQRLALTFSDKGMSVRPVGSRKPPREITWAALLPLLDRTEAPPAATSETPPPSEPVKPAPSAEMVTQAPAASGPVPALLERLEKWLTQHRKRFAKSLQLGASAADLDTLEAALGRALPAELRTLLAWHNGQKEGFVDCFYERFYLMSTQQIAETHAQMLREDAERWKPEWIPFLNDDRDNAVFLDTTQSPAAVREFWQRNPEQPTTAPSLSAWLKDFVTAVEADRFTQDDERGHFIRAT